MAETLFVIDAFAHIYQFFYAIKGLTGPDGEPVNAVYGLARMIEGLRRRYRPDYMVAAFDEPGELVRKQVYEGYKAGRPPMPEDLERQLPLIEEMFDAMGVPRLSAQGYEADDVLAAVAVQATQSGVNTVIVTTDKDAEQLIDEHTRVLHVHKDREEMLDPEALKETKGIEPGQVVDVMSLAGDSTDNVPGVPGVGPKTALKLIRQFGSVEGVYANLDQVSGAKLRERLAGHREDVRLAADLVKLKPDIPVELDLAGCRLPAETSAEAQAFYRALGFRSLAWAAPGARRAEAAEPRQGDLFARRSGAPSTSPGAQGDEPVEPQEEQQALASLETVETDYSAVTDLDELRALAAEMSRQDVLSVDLETTSLQPRRARIVGIAFSWRPHQGVYVATDGPSGTPVCPLEEALRLLRPILEADAPAKVGQNLKYDMAVLRNWGIELGGVRCDSMVASYLLRPSERTHGLDALARRYLGYRPVAISELIGEGKQQLTMDHVPVEQVAPYACEDADLALQLSELLSRRLRDEDLWDLFADLEMPLVAVLTAMEWHGVKVDTGQLASLSTEFAGQVAELERDIYRAAGREFNVNSPQQLSQVLFEELGLPAPRGRRTATGHSTASDVLEGIKDQHPVVAQVLRYRGLSKLKSTYADALLEMVDPETGRVHTSFNQTVTATGRLSSSDPNLQNIPVRTEPGRRIRRAFVAGADDMSLLSADYSQVELRIVAHCSGDPALRHAFLQDRDIHRFVAAQVNGVAQEDVSGEMRQQAKAVNFGIIYGLSPYGLSQQIGVRLSEAEDFIRQYFERYPKVKEFIERTVEQARQDGYVRTLAGRRRRIEGLHASGARRGAAERIAVNTVIQGSAADLIKLAMVQVHRGLASVSERAKMLIQIHDELVFEAPDAELGRVAAFVADEMDGALKLDVPLKVHIATGKNWADAK